MLETFGDTYRVSLPYNTTIIERNAFANLSWLCGSERVNGEDFFTSRSKLHRAIRAIRVAKTANWFHATKWNSKARVRNQFMQSGFSFCHIDQRGTGRDYTPPIATVGNADYQNATDSEFTGWESRLAKGTSQE